MQHRLFSQHRKTFKEFDFVKTGRNSQRCDVDFLREILSTPPPKIETVNEFEVYKVGEDGKRIRRICGQPQMKKLPSFVPDGVANPYDVKNPYEEYVCTHGAGWGRGTEWGPCKYHNHFGKLNKRLAKKAMQYEQIKREGIAVPAADFKSHLKKVQSEITPDELFELTAPLYQFEALKSMLIEQMEDSGALDQESIKQIADIISKSANVKLTQAKFESKMLKNKQIERLVEALINGMLASVEQVVDSSQFARIIDIFKNEVLIPISENGFSELFLRQSEAGLHDRYEVLGPSSDTPDVKVTERERE